MPSYSSVSSGRDRGSPCSSCSGPFARRLFLTFGFVFVCFYFALKRLHAPPIRMYSVGNKFSRTPVAEAASPVTSSASRKNSSRNNQGEYFDLLSWIFGRSPSPSSSSSSATPTSSSTTVPSAPSTSDAKAREQTNPASATAGAAAGGTVVSSGGATSTFPSTGASTGVPPNSARFTLHLFALGEYELVSPGHVSLKPYMRLNLESWRQHLRVIAPGGPAAGDTKDHPAPSERKVVHFIEPKIVLLNNQNVRKWIKDVPDEYFRLPYSAAKSDAVRYAVLHHNGGIYLDTDILMQRDVHPKILFSLLLTGGADPAFDKSVQDAYQEFVMLTGGPSAAATSTSSANDPSGVLGSSLTPVEMLSYEGDGQNCLRGWYSSNFLGSSKGSEYMDEVWRRQKKALTTHCKEMKELKEEKICCMANPKVECHIPWTQLGEGISHKVGFKIAQPRGPSSSTGAASGEGDQLPGASNKEKNQLAAYVGAAKVNPVMGYKTGTHEQQLLALPVGSSGLKEFYVSAGEARSGKTTANVVICYNVPENFVPIPPETYYLSVMNAAYWNPKVGRLKDPHPLLRTAYHMFNSNAGHGSKTCAKLLDREAVMGQLYRQALLCKTTSGVVPPPPHLYSITTTSDTQLDDVTERIGKTNPSKRELSSINSLSSVGFYFWTLA
ncbi:unnamed protein product [Amoebophrya sp. A120]|nr:unnamed protein product [Amoebophrya sp. A120]|eukprot:GSA120T00010404001.1